MEPHRGLRRTRWTATSTRSGRAADTSRAQTPASYAAGEDILATAIDAPETPLQTPERARQVARTRQPLPAPDQKQRQRAVAETLAPDETRRARWRRPAPRQVALTRLTRGLEAGASVARRPLRLLTPKRTLSASVTLALLLALCYWLFASAYWQTRDVRIQGTSDPMLIALARAQRLTGCNAFRCDFSAARQAIASSPHVEHVAISVVFPHTTLVSITQRQTAALWRTQTATWAVGDDGVIIGALGSEPGLSVSGAAVVDDPGGVALAGRAPQPGAHMDAALVAMARQLRTSATGAGLDPTSLRYSAANGFTMQARGAGTLIEFGMPVDAQNTLTDLTSAAPAPQSMHLAQVTPGQVAQGAKMQAEAAAAVLARLAKTGASATLIDVRWGGHPYYR